MDGVGSHVCVGCKDSKKPPCQILRWSALFDLGELVRTFVDVSAVCDLCPYLDFVPARGKELRSCEMGWLGLQQRRASQYRIDGQPAIQDHSSC